MDVKPITDLLHWIEGMTGDPLFARVLIALGLLFLTWLTTRLVVNALRRFFIKEDSSLVESSFYFTLVKAVIWIVGVSIILDGCFNVNMSAFIAALGVSGIAISLGFQDTLSNLFGGAAITLTGVIRPGDNISVSSYTGVVQDIQWRHTVLKDPSGEEVYIPNSVISKNPVVKLDSPQDISVPISIISDRPVNDVAREMCEAAKKAASPVVDVIGDVVFQGTAVKHYGIDGSLSLTIGDADKQFDAIDAIVRAVEPIAKGTQPDADDAESA